MERKLFNIGTSKEFINKNVEIVNNTEDEILKLAKEALTLHGNKYRSLDKKIGEKQKNMQVILQNHDSFKTLYWTNKIGMDFISTLNI